MQGEIVRRSCRRHGAEADGSGQISSGGCPRCARFDPALGNGRRSKEQCSNPPFLTPKDPSSNPSGGFLERVMIQQQRRWSFTRNARENRERVETQAIAKKAVSLILSAP